MFDKVKIRADECLTEREWWEECRKAGEQRKLDSWKNKNI